ncbi:MAG: leucine-rich repeat domain-containing protein [Acetatifactor sp.]|nr:leucine-rich repeat domain-containing protein [Acetatifactor sp.]
MRKRKRLCGVLMIIAALVIMQLPVSEADAATSASDFQMEGNVLTKYRGTDTEVTVPNTVSVIGEGAFENNGRITRVILPNSVEQIKPYAFWGCDNLSTVSLGSGLTEVGDYAFAGAKGLKRMTIPNSVTRIGIGAFADCVNMEEITIPAVVSHIHETAFDGCAKLKINCMAGSLAYKFAQEFYERQKEMPEYEDVSNYQPDSSTAGTNTTDNNTGNSTSTNTNTNTNTNNSGRIPNRDDNVQINPDILGPSGDVLGSTYVVGNHAVVFLDNTSPEVLSGTSITPVTPEIVQPNFENNVQGTTGSTIPKYTIVDGDTVADQAYYRNRNLQAVTLPEEINEIGQFAFARSSVSQLVIPEGTREIAYGAFYHCDNLTQVNLPTTLINVEPKAFAHTAWVDQFLAGTGGESDFLVNGNTLVAYRGSGSAVEVPEGVTLIAAEVFQDHTEITDVILPESLLVIGEGAFEGCSGLKEATFGSQVTDIKDRAFAGTALEHVALPATLKRIGLQAFPETAGVGYAGVAPEKVHEISAERLSNEAYRGSAAESGQSGVKVDGLDGALAQLDGASRSYTLSIWEATDAVRTEVELAFQRNLHQTMPANIQLYGMSLTDSSGIPINKTGRQVLTVTLPVPERFAETGVQVVLLDRNGQLESVSAMRLLVDGVDCVRFDTNFLSVYGLYGDGTVLNTDYLIQTTTTLESMAAPPDAAVMGGSSHLKIYRWLVGGLLLLAGMVLVIGRPLKNRI